MKKIRKSDLKIMLSRLRNNKLINDVFQLASGTAGAQIIALSTVPLITRLYGPEAYGILGVFVAISGILIPIAALTLPVAIVLPKTNKEAKNIFMTSIYLSTIIAGLMLLTILLLNKQIVDLLNIEEIKQYLYLYPIIILAASFTQVTQNFLYRNGEFKEVARATFLSSLITNLSKVLLGFKWQSAGLLIVITSSAVLIQGIIQFRRSLKSLKLSLIELDVSYKVFKKYKNFPFYKAPETFINAISHSMPVVLLSIFFNPIAAGFYTIAVTVLSKPTQLIAESVGDVFYPRIAENANKKLGITSSIIKATLILSALGVIPFSVIIIFGPGLFEFTFGNEWARAGEYARWIAVWSFFMFINRPVVRSLQVISEQLFHLKFTLIVTFVRIITLSLSLYFFENELASIAIYGIIGGISNLFLIFMTLIKTRRFDVKNLRA